MKRRKREKTAGNREGTQGDGGRPVRNENQTATGEGNHGTTVHLCGTLLKRNREQ